MCEWAVVQDALTNLQVLSTELGRTAVRLWAAPLASNRLLRRGRFMQGKPSLHWPPRKAPTVSPAITSGRRRWRKVMARYRRITFGHSRRQRACKIDINLLLGRSW